MTCSFAQKYTFGSAWVRSLLVLSILTLGAFAPANAETATAQNEPHRNGPFVLTDKLLSDLLKDGYEIRATLGTSLVLQKSASVYSCSVVPDQKTLSYQPYFACSELRERLAKDE